MEWSEGDKESPELPSIAEQAKERHFSAVNGLNKKRRELSDKLNSDGLQGEAKNRLLVPVIEKKLRHQNAVKAIDSEWKINVPKEKFK